MAEENLRQKNFKKIAKRYCNLSVSVVRYIQFLREHKMRKEVATMKNTFTVSTVYESRTFTADQFVEVLRDLLNVTAEVAKMTMHKMEEGRTYLARSVYRMVKNKAEA